MFRSEVALHEPCRTVLLVLALSGALTSCDTESPSSGPTRETLANGAVLVRYPTLPSSDSVGARVTEAQVDLKFGSIEGDDLNLIFGDVRGIQAAGDGTIYVLDQQAAEVRVFDSGGEYLRTIVRRGEGPSEVGDANGIILSGDTLLWIHDTRKWTIIGVNPTGDEVRRFFKPVMTYGYIWDGVFDNRDRYWRTTTHGEDDPGYPPPPGLSSWSERRYYKSYELSSGATDSVYFGKASFQVYAYTTPAGWGFLPIPFQAVELIDVNPSGGFWRAHPASYRIVRTGEGGDTLVVIEAGLPVHRITNEDRSAHVDGIVEDRPELRREAEEVAALMPDVKPALEGLLVDDEGRLWVERVTPKDAPSFYDRYSEDGEYLGSVRLAFEPAGPIWVQHGDIYAWVVDEFEVQYVVRASIRR
ncbi:MAG: hypothetical protein J4G12_09120 [Gemmatimonadetes bacterium]|nr:hypothetical protein [Gemmatimonadota bacterium]